MSWTKSHLPRVTPSGAERATSCSTTSVVTAIWASTRSSGILAAAMLAILAGCSKAPVPAESAAEVSPPEDFGRPITALREDLESGAVTSEALVRHYQQRIEALDRSGPTLQSVLALNPDAIDEARALDQERKEKGSRGPMHGIPVLLKDNINAVGKLPTTAGSLALIENFATADSPLVANLRNAGAVILGKTNLSEWANFRSTHSLSGWSGVGGFTKNAHVLDRSACGSSAGSGTAMAAGLAAATVGTETDGSITCPSSMNGIVGLKPTVGLLSQQGIVPISHSQDAAGPMTVSVMDAALMLTAMVGDQPACDSAIPGCKKADYLSGLKSDALQGKRIGVLRHASGRNPRQEPVYQAALDHLRAAGATLVEVKLPDMKRIDEGEDVVLHVEFKADLNAYLATTPATVKSRDLNSLIEFNKGSERELMLFGQEIFLQSEATAGLQDAGYKSALADSQRLARAGITQLLASQKLDMLVAPTTGTAWRIDTVNGDHSSASFSTLPAVAGYPHLTVPMGEIDHLPIGLSFIGAAYSEDRLLAAGYAFEERAKARIKPAFLPTIDADKPAFKPNGQSASQ